MPPAGPSATVAETLHDAARRLGDAGIDDARLEAEVLLALALGIDRSHLLARLRDTPPPDTVARFAALLARRLTHEPLAYITGHREFYGIDILCAPGALIPRQETEQLVELAVEDARRRGVGARIIDVGTGTGAIAAAIALHAPGAHVLAVDASTAALAVARSNVERLGLADRIELRAADLLEGAGAFDIIVANLPYVSEGAWATLAPEIRLHEPREALVAGPAGTEAIERLLEQAPANLALGGTLAAEIGDEQGAALKTAASRSFPQGEVCVMKDLAGLDRVLVVRT